MYLKKVYLPSWTNETFKIFKVNRTIPPIYILNDNKGNVLKGALYEQELLRTKVGDVYLFEKILRKDLLKTNLKHFIASSSCDSIIDMESNMDIDVAQLPKRRYLPPNFITDVFFKNVYFLNSDSSKFAVAGLFRNKCPGSIYLFENRLSVLDL